MTRTGSTRQPRVIIPAEGSDAKVYEMAMRRAIEALHADGGAIATKDHPQDAIATKENPQDTLLLRVRQVHPRLRPLRPSAHPISAGDDNSPEPSEDIEEISTTVLPTTRISRQYQQGERLIGYTWMTGKPVIMSGEEVQGLPGSNSPEDPPAAYHLAVPIFAPVASDVARPLGAGGQEDIIIGVMTVYNIDPNWRFTQNQIALLEAHAANLAQAVILNQLAWQEQRHRRVLSLLQELTGDLSLPNQASSSPQDAFYESFFDRIYVAIRASMEVDAFAVALSQADGSLMIYSIVENQQRTPYLHLRADQATWWPWVHYGNHFGWRNEEEKRRARQLDPSEWGMRHEMTSQLFVPIKGATEVIGALIVGCNRPFPYPNDHGVLLEMVGRFTALALENAHLRAARTGPLNAGTQATNLAHSLLINAMLGLNATLSVEAIIHDLVEQASELARGQICGYLEYDRHQDELVIRDIAQNKDHLYSEILNQRLAVGEGRLRQALQGQEQLLDGLLEDYDRGDTIGTLLQRYSVQALLLVPVILQENGSHYDRVIGLLGIYSPDQQALFSPGETMNLLALGRVAAANINNARTYAQLRELDKLKDDFILTASHEFRTPMSAIQGFSWLIQRRGDTMTPEQARRWASEISRATDQLKDMMDTITESWRTNSVQLPPPKPLQVATALALALEILSSQLAAEQHETINQVPEDLWVLGEPDRLRHVFSNLLANAAKYSPPNTRIVISAAIKSAAQLLAVTRQRGAVDEGEDPAEFVTPTSGPWAVISVRDEGQGISLIDQSRLFAKFVRLQLTTNVRGTGLGLYICRRYIEGMGGEIWVESAPGQGATFSFCLPLIEAPIDVP